MQSQPPIDLVAAPLEVADPAQGATPQKIPNVAVDVLYESQRGAWLCGLPLFSSASLLNFDPPAWRSGNGKASAVDVTNAQTPDPSWLWAWPTWYVDMGRDVDEEGWEYSFAFWRRDERWHGSHPWFHSFVRRRRWIRKRVRRRHGQAAEVPSEDRNHKQDSGHRLNADYFTIHPAKQLTRGTSYAASTTISAAAADKLRLAQQQEDEDDEPKEIDSMSTLLRVLKRARTDREKIGLVMQFLDQGGDDIYYLADEMSHILSMFFFQYTRRQLLSRMLQRIDTASDHRQEHERRDEVEGSDEKRKIDNLLRAVRAAEKEVQALEYWSDIRDIVQKGESFSGVGEHGWEHGWEGIDVSGPSQAQLPATDEHGHITYSEARTAGGTAQGPE